MDAWTIGMLVGASFALISYVGLSIIAVVLQIKNKEWKWLGATVFSFVVIAFFLSTILASIVPLCYIIHWWRRQKRVKERLRRERYEQKDN